MLCLSLEQALDPGLLAARAGTLQAGGLLVLFRDSRSSLSTAWQERFERLLNAYIEQNPDIASRVSMAASLFDTLFDERDKLAALVGPSLPIPDPPELAGQDAVGDQQRLVDAGYRFLRSAGRRRLVVRAPRGYGKSTLIARIAARLLDDGYSLVACSPHASGLSRLSEEVAGVRRLAPEQIASSLPNSAVLLIDEAASLPITEVDRLLDLAERAVIAGTTEGYELSGRAFDLYTDRHLEAVHDHVEDQVENPLAHRQQPDLPAWLRLEPAHNFRLHPEDPLARLLDALTGNWQKLENRPPAPTATQRVASALPALRIVELSRAELLAEEGRLRALWELLARTHYQSSSKDFRHLIDNDRLTIWSAFTGSKPCAVALITREGELSTELAEPILAGRRRPDGNLLPQLLALCLQSPSPLAALYLRVLRIATQEQWRRRGIATALMQAIETKYLAEGVSIGASFGASDSSLAFWQSLGYQQFHRGARANPRSGLPSTAVLKAASVEAGRLLEAAVAVFKENCHARSRLPAWLGIAPARHGDAAEDSARFQGFQADNGISQLAGSPRGQCPSAHRQLTAFASNRRSFDNSLAALLQLVELADTGTEPLAQELYRISTARPGAERRQRERRLRDAVGSLLEKSPV